MQIPKRHRKILGIFLIACGITLIFGLFLASEIKPAIEIPGGEIREIPKDIAAKLQNNSSAINYRIPIFLYHYVEYVQDKNDKLRLALNVNPDVFEKQIKTLLASHYNFLTAKDLGEILDGKMQLPANPILLTFDDGHWDFDTNVLPILKKYKIKATAYIITGFIGKSDFMTKTELQDVIDSGLVDVGAHTVHHVALKKKLSLVARYEIFQSKKWLESNFNIKVLSFAYPDGSFDSQAINLVRQDEFTTAVSTIKGVNQSINNRFYLYRVRPGSRTGQSLINFLNKLN